MFGRDEMVDSKTAAVTFYILSLYDHRMKAVQLPSLVGLDIDRLLAVVVCTRRANTISTCGYHALHPVHYMILWH